MSTYWLITADAVYAIPTALAAEWFGRYRIVLGTYADAEAVRIGPVEEQTLFPGEAA